MPTKMKPLPADANNTEPPGEVIARRGKPPAKIVYQCPGCGRRVWARRGLFIICRSCDDPLEETRPANSRPPPLPRLATFPQQGV